MQSQDGRDVTAASRSLQLLLLRSFEAIQAITLKKRLKRVFTTNTTTTSISTATTTSAVLRPFVPDYPGEPVPEELSPILTLVLIINHPLSASSIYCDP